MRRRTKSERISMLMAYNSIRIELNDSLQIKGIRSSFTNPYAIHATLVIGIYLEESIKHPPCSRAYRCLMSLG